MSTASKDVRIAGLGWDVADDRVDSFRLGHPDSLLGYDAVIWDVLSSAKASSPYASPAAAKRRLQELQDHTKRGKPLLVMVPPPSRVSHLDPLQELSMLDLLPLELETRTARGKNFELIAGAPFSDLWGWVKGIATHEAIIDTPVGTPVLKIRGSEAVVACSGVLGAAPVLLMPSLADDFSYEDEYQLDDGQYRSHIDVVDAILTYFDAVKGDDEVPAWTNAYLLPGESDLQARLSRDRATIIKAEARITKRMAALADLRRKKLLVTATGTALEQIVDRAFRALGCEVEPGPEGRADRIVRYGSKAAVLEIKGLTRSASESDATQLSKWVAEYRGEHGKTAKGILVANAWRKRPLEERTQRAFPKQMLRYAVDQQQQCLVTTSQLLGAWLAAEEDPKSGGRFLKQLFGCKGVFPDYQDWREFLPMADQDED